MTVFFSQSVSQLFHGPAPRSPRCSSHTVIDDAQKTLRPPFPPYPKPSVYLCMRCDNAAFHADTKRNARRCGAGAVI